MQRLYGVTEHIRRIALWDPEHHDVEPSSIGAVGSPTPVPMELQFDGEVASDACSSDKWIGAVAWSVAAREQPQPSLYRLPFLSRDRRNDWTAIVEIMH